MTIRQDIVISQGETWSWVYTHRNSAGAAIDLTGYSARMIVKRDYDAALEAYLSSGGDADGGSISLGGAAGTVTLSMTAAQSDELGGGSLQYIFPAYALDDMPDDPPSPTIEMIYNLELVSSSGVVTRALEGRVVVRRRVST